MGIFHEVSGFDVRRVAERDGDLARVDAELVCHRVDAVLFPAGLVAPAFE